MHEQINEFPYMGGTCVQIFQSYISQSSVKRLYVQYMHNT